MKTEELEGRPLGGRILPRVSIVVTCYNRKCVVGSAIDSALEQTYPETELILVDDRSTDGTYKELAARASADGFALLSTDRQSGSAGAPRNIGLKHASGEYTLFLDSDDVLLPEACEVMIRIAQNTGADLVCGASRRKWLDNDRVDLWRPEIYQEAWGPGPIGARPVLLWDTNATAKLYRTTAIREWGLSFPEGRVYEDLVFTTSAYAAAGKIAVTPTIVYEWRIGSQSGQRSVTSSLDLPGNLEARLEAWRDIDRIASTSLDSSCQRELDFKFLRHDAWLYLRQAILSTESEKIKRVCSALYSRVSESHPQAMQRLHTFRRLAYSSLLSGDARAVVQAASHFLWQRRIRAVAGQLSGWQWSAIADDGFPWTDPDDLIWTVTSDGQRMAENSRSVNLEKLSRPEDQLNGIVVPFVGVTTVSHQGDCIEVSGVCHRLLAERSRKDSQAKPSGVRLVARYSVSGQQREYVQAVDAVMTPWGFKWHGAIPAPRRLVRPWLDALLFLRCLDESLDCDIPVLSWQALTTSDSAMARMMGIPLRLEIRVTGEARNQARMVASPRNRVFRALTERIRIVLRKRSRGPR